MIAHKAGGPTTVPSIVCEVRRNRARLAQYRIIQTIRILSRSHRRFTEERKVKVIRSLIKETRITATGIEFEMYIEPTERAVEISAEQNAQENFPQQGSACARGMPQPPRPGDPIYSRTGREGVRHFTRSSALEN